MVLHFSYDRIFQTPAFENILLSSSPQIVSLDPAFLRLPVLPSHGNYYEAGFTKGFVGKFKLDGNYYPPVREQLCRRRSVAQYLRQLSYCLS